MRNIGIGIGILGSLIAAVWLLQKGESAVSDEKLRGLAQKANQLQLSYETCLFGDKAIEDWPVVQAVRRPIVGTSCRTVWLE